MSHHQSIKPPIRRFAKAMRQHPTDAEAAMWRLLRNRRLLQFKFRRQAPFQNYILDFVCFDKQFIVELDGSQHAPDKDAERTATLHDKGFEIARYWNNEVLQNPTSVLEDILQKLANKS